MYKKLEEEFKEKSHFHKDNKKLLANSAAFLFVVLLFVSSIKMPEWVAGIITALALFAIPISVYLFVGIRDKDYKGFFLDNKKWIKRLRARQDEKDIAILRKMLLENNINSKEKVQECLRHYQVLVPISQTYHSVFLAILMAALAVLSLVFNIAGSFESWKQDSFAQEFFMICTYGILILACAWLLYCGIQKLFGNFYKQLEEFLSSIYFEYQDVKKTTRKARVSKQPQP